jgi:hypothetical protein
MSRFGGKTAHEQNLPTAFGTAGIAASRKSGRTQRFSVPPFGHSVPEVPIFQFPHHFYLEGFTIPNLFPYPIGFCVHT